MNRNSKERFELMGEIMDFVNDMLEVDLKSTHRYIKELMLLEPLQD